MRLKVIGSVLLAIGLFAQSVSASPFGYIIYKNTSGGQQQYLVSTTSYPTRPQAEVAAQQSTAGYNKTAPPGISYTYYIKDFGS